MENPTHPKTLHHTLITNGDQGQMVQAVRQKIQDWQSTYANEISGNIWIYEENDATPYLQVTDFDNQTTLFKGLKPTLASDFLNNLQTTMQQNFTQNQAELNIIVIDDFESTTWSTAKQTVLTQLFETGAEHNFFTIFINSPYANLTQDYRNNFAEIIDFSN
ncbi:hypothetical protein D3P96_05395 [Weissella viridescens]|uniref:Uncharacterized protein n=1 Tax=Weissella viridescens TaxID=1629 RepID=A0A3P2RBC4_WEIVI|nr:hypothetical protein [Weissella viridescens]RRG17834.1 hypothetical protein D3P96_05395 [Weissella viridescens]